MLGYNNFGQLVGDANNRGDNPDEMGDNLPYVDVGGTVVQLELGKVTHALFSTTEKSNAGDNDVGQLG